MRLLDKIVHWVRVQSRPVSEDEIIARFTPERTKRPRGLIAIEKAKQADRHRRNDIKGHLRRGLNEQRLVLTEAGYDLGPGPQRSQQPPIIPTIFRMLRASPHRTVAEPELMAEMDRLGVSRTQFLNNMQVRISARQIKREVVDGVRFFTLLESDPLGKPETDSYEQWQEKTDRQKFDDGERALSRLMGDRRFEDHPRARLTFLPARFDRASAIVPRGSTSSQCVEARL